MTQTQTEVETWLPVFSGFYGTIWETDFDEESEIDYINAERERKGLEAITWDDVEWDYTTYHQDVALGVTRWIGEELKKLKLISDFSFQELRSPREYNFANDAIHVKFVLTNANRETIRLYLENHRDVFKAYVESHYSTRSGFFSYYSNNGSDWLCEFDEMVEHKHKLGAVLDFILRNEDEGMEIGIQERVNESGVILQAKNYAALIGEEK